ncbi:hypothetical protein [Methanocella arvoryzae]|uniref:Uncharacterized protein n=1 Tax=Methanocella arvoryzae (strain DSM 22066 / NBRC 105507 / MRE50) TaxID=351160 RepID=Q0W0H7_METAR|nr:hypothetical protein [Methanocella arvoryzae]CAJ38116.1 hypothetical protein RRC411 [Methanocella arvoryzae MRE50]
MKLWKLAIILLVITIALPVTCIGVDMLSNQGKEAIVFLEHKNNVRGQLVSGHFPGKTLSGEEYTFDAERSVLTCRQNPGINGSLKVLVGTTQSLMQDAGYGISTRLLGVPSYPANVDGINIDGVLEDGTVLIRYNGSSIRLSPGQRWVKVYTENVETDDYRVKLTNTEIIKNNGKIRLEPAIV